MKRCVLCSLFTCVLVLMWPGLSKALVIPYEFEGFFDAGPLAGERFNGFFQYDTGGDPTSQMVFSSVSVPGTSLNDSFSTITVRNQRLELEGLGAVSPRVDWLLRLRFDEKIDLIAPLPLNALAGTFFGYFDEGVSAILSSTGELDRLNIRGVPEPTTMLLVGSGLLGLLAFRRRVQRVPTIL